MPRKSQEPPTTMIVRNGRNRGGAGRKCMLTPELIEQCQTAIQNHSSATVTCELTGISRDTFYRWLKEGEASNGGLKRDFYEAVTRARAMGKVVLTQRIADDSSWQAKAWLLERLYPKEFGRRKVIVYVSPEDDAPPCSSSAINVNFVNVQASHT